MVVMKFGGSSIRSPERMNRIIQIIEKHISKTPVFIFSALGKTTRELLQLVQYAEDGKMDTMTSSLKKLEKRHWQFAESMVQQFPETDYGRMLRSYFEEIEKRLNTISQSNVKHQKDQDYILAFGELISTAIITSILKTAGIPACLMDARKMVVTDDWYSQANPNLDITYQNIHEQVSPVLKSGQCPVLQGFIGSTPAGETTTLGFEGSDFTTALVGAALEAENIQIWKDVPGLMTADPSIYPEAEIVRHISYDEAAVLTAAGAKVLHPKTIAPVRKLNIPVLIKDCNQPNLPGTVISHPQDTQTGIVKSIAHSQAFCFQISQKNEETLKDISQKIHNLAEAENLTLQILQDTNTCLLFILPAYEYQKHFIEKISGFCTPECIKTKSLLTLVGHQLVKNSQLKNKIIDLLKIYDFTLHMEKEEPSKMTLLVDEMEQKTILNMIHKEIFN